MFQYDFIGVDIAKDKFDVSKSTENKSLHKVFENNSVGFKAFLAWLKKHSTQPWVCMEATGHYSELLADFLTEQAIRVSVVNPFQIKYFAKAKLARNKNDTLDAKVISEYCKVMTPRVFEPRPAEQKAIRELIQLLDTLKTQKTQLTNQLNTLQTSAAKKAIQKAIAQLDKQLKKIETDIGTRVEENEKWRHMLSLFLSIKGMGKLSAYRLLAYLPDLRFFQNAKQLAAFIGVSPKQHESGKFIGKTCLSKFGNSRLRNTLYMPALSAKRFNEHFKPFVNRLEKRGLAPKAIVGALMRKLVHIIFGILKSNQPFNPILV